MILDHIAQCAGMVVVLAPMLHPDLFGDGDLHMVDVVPVPYGLEEEVGKTKGQYVLDRLFAQVMVNTIDLGLVQKFSQGAVEGLGRVKVPPERLLHYDPAVPVVPGETGLVQVADDGLHERRRCGKIIDMFAVPTPCFLFLGKGFAQSGEGLRVVEVTDSKGLKVLGKSLPFRGIGLAAPREPVCPLVQVFAPFLLSERFPIYTINGKLPGQEVIEEEVVQRGDQFPPRQVTRRAKDDQGDGRTLRFDFHGSGLHFTFIDCKSQSNQGFTDIRTAALFISV